MRAPALYPPPARRHPNRTADLYGRVAASRGLSIVHGRHRHLGPRHTLGQKGTSPHPLHTAGWANLSLETFRKAPTRGPRGGHVGATPHLQSTTLSTKPRTRCGWTRLPGGRDTIGSSALDWTRCPFLPFSRGQYTSVLHPHRPPRPGAALYFSPCNPLSTGSPFRVPARVGSTIFKYKPLLLARPPRVPIALNP